jgi:acyl-CoA reductase-like NAD-dependent aldehyde dehydrogenase
MEAALAAAGAPPGLVHFVTGYGDAGHALVTGGVDKVGGCGGWGCRRGGHQKLLVCVWGGGAVVYMGGGRSEVEQVGELLGCTFI